MDLLFIFMIFSHGSSLCVWKILHASQNGYEAYTTCREVLSHLNESVPESIKPLQAASLLLQTSKVLNNMSDEDLMNMQQNDGTGVSHFTQKFYMLMV